MFCSITWGFSNSLQNLDWSVHDENTTISFPKRNIQWLYAFPVFKFVSSIGLYECVKYLQSSSLYKCV